MKTLKCEECKKSFKRYKAHIRSKRYFCTRICKDNWQKQGLKNEGNPRWNSVKIHCIVCTKGFFIRRSHTILRLTCSRKCQGYYRSLLASPVNYYRKKEWLEMRVKALKRDNEICQRCKKTARTVHHKDCDPSNNVLSNLITVCTGCHNTIHSEVTKT